MYAGQPVRLRTRLRGGAGATAFWRNGGYFSSGELAEGPGLRYRARPAQGQAACHIKNR